MSITFRNSRLETFKFSSKTYIYPNVPFDIKKEISRLCRIHSELKIIQDVDIEEQGIFQFLQASYLREVWVTESVTSMSYGNTEEVAIQVVEGVSKKPDFVSDKQWQTLININDALDYLKAFRDPSLVSDITFSVDLLKSVHRIVGKNIIENAGEFRITEVGAAGTSVVYCPHKLVSKKIVELISFVNNAVVDASHMSDSDRLSRMIQVAALFFSGFLLIHPFSNGNGRTCRLLVNLLLFPVTIVPFSIFLDVDREEYLRILISSQQCRNHDALMMLFLVSAMRTANIANFLFLTTEDSEFVSNSLCEACSFCIAT